MNISIFENLKALLPTEKYKKNARWKLMITTKERLVLTVG
jgi:hypothetical protein